MRGGLLWVTAAVAVAAAAVYVGETDSGPDADVRTAAVGTPSAAAKEAAISPYHLGAAPTWRVQLPASLMEISGIAFTPDGRLFAHGDESATLRELNGRTGEVHKTFALRPGTLESELGSEGAAVDGKKSKKRARAAVAAAGTVPGDFEDIAIVGDLFFLVTSTGTLYEFREGSHGARVPYTVYRTGLEGRCEVEGLTYDGPDNALLLLCKENLPKRSAPRQVVVYAWSLREKRLSPSPRLAVDHAAMAGSGVDAFNGSAFAFVPGTRSLVLVAGPQSVFAEIGADGLVAAAGPLDRRVHPQPEGLAFAPDGTLLIANEGAGGQPSLSGYAPKTADE